LFRSAEHFMRLFHRQPGAAVIRGFEHTGDGEFFRKLLRRCADLDDMLDRLEALAINGGAVARFRCERRVERLDDPQAIVNVAHDDLSPRTGGTRSPRRSAHLRPHALYGNIAQLTWRSRGRASLGGRREPLHTCNTGTHLTLRSS